MTLLCFITILGPGTKLFSVGRLPTCRALGKFCLVLGYILILFVATDILMSGLGVPEGEGLGVMIGIKPFLLFGALGLVLNSGLYPHSCVIIGIASLVMMPFSSKDSMVV